MFDTEDVTRGFFLYSPLKEESAVDTPPQISNAGSWLCVYDVGITLGVEPPLWGDSE